MSRIEKRSITVTADPAAGAGAATADQTLEFSDLSEIYAIRLTYANLPATTDVTITDDYANGSTVLSQANSNTSKKYYPRIPDAESADGTASTLTEDPVVAERIRVQLAQGDPSGTVTVDAFITH